MVRRVVGVGWLALVACGGAEPPPPSDDVLELELGGPYQPLAAALRAAEPAGVPKSATSLPEVSADPSPASRSPAAIAPELAPPPPKQSSAITVVLGRGETVYGLAKAHLGTGARFSEILDLNGWTEAQARRLPAGTRVKLPSR